MGFGPTDPFEPPVFKTGVIDHSTTLPNFWWISGRVERHALRTEFTARRRYPSTLLTRSMVEHSGNDPDEAEAASFTDWTVSLTVYYSICNLTIAWLFISVACRNRTDIDYRYPPSDSNREPKSFEDFRTTD